MAENEQQTTQPVFRMQKMYIKDLSFESPHAPLVFRTDQKHEPAVELDMKLNNEKLSDDNYEISMTLNAKMVDKANQNAVLMAVEIEHAAIFLIRGVPEAQMERVLRVDCPFLLFPYTRQIISQITQDGGFMPLMLDPINFVAMYESMKQQQGKES